MTVKEVTIKRLEVTDEGRSVMLNGSHEYNVFKMVPAEGILKSIIDVSRQCCILFISFIPISQQPKNKTNFQKQSFGAIGFGKAIQCGWIRTEVRGGAETYVVRKVEAVEDVACDQLKLIEDGKNDAQFSGNTLSQLKKRKWIIETFVYLNCLFVLSKAKNVTFYLL